MGGKGLEGSWAASAQRGVKLERLPFDTSSDTSVHSPIHNDFSRPLRLKICRNKKKGKRSLGPEADGRLEMPDMALRSGVPIGRVKPDDRKPALVVISSYPSNPKE